MAEVLTRALYANSDGEPDRYIGMTEALIVQKAVDALTAAGFGLVADAKAEALEEAAASIDSGGRISQWLRARAAAVRGEG
jgi:hypothetical protein